LHSDHGGKYLGKEFTLYLKSRGTEQRLTVHDTPQHNGVAEWRNRTIVERIRALLHSSGLPKNLWGEAARHVIWLMNRTLTKAIDGMMPYEATFGKKPDLWHVREWGEKVWVHIEGGDKLGGHIKEGRWLGIDECSKGFRIYWPEKRTVTTERNVYYDKLCLSVCRLEGEDWEFVKTKTDLPKSSTSIIPTPVLPAVSSPTESRAPSPSPSDNPDPHQEEPVHAKHVRKLSQRVCNLLEGRGATSDRPSDPTVTASVRVPPIAEEAQNPVLEGVPFTIPVRSTFELETVTFSSSGS
jgi:hypothetical protein